MDQIEQIIAWLNAQPESMEALGKKAGVNPRTIANIRNRKHGPSYKSLMKIWDLMNADKSQHAA